ncbi:MAG: hypothetical protein GY926_19260, partial [bacterium]|nr:hypothetical protein [bacterium]
ILVAGQSYNGSDYDFTLTRYNTDGSLDTDFDGDGKLTTAIGSGDDIGKSVTVQSDGKILVAGQSHNGSDYDFALVRYNADGSLDTTFDTVNTLDGTPTFIEDGAAVVLDVDVDVSDSELDALNGGLGNYDGASLTLVRNGGVSTEDVFSFSDGNGITLSGGNLIKNSQIIASFDITTTAGELVITFTNANGETPTSVDVDNILRQITYANSSEDPPASAQIDWSFDDGNTGSQGTGGALQAVGSTTVTITAVNDTPTLAATAANATLTENTDVISAAVFSTVTIDLIETGDDIASAQLTITGGIENTDTLTINGTAITGLGSDSSGAITGGHSYSYTQATGVVTITFAGSTNAAAAELVLENITYGIDASDQDPSTTARTVTLNTVTDNGGGADTNSDISETATISVAAVNDLPTAANNTVSTDDGTPYAFTAANFNFSDIDGDTMASVKVTTLETVGALQLQGVDVTLNQVITRADIDAGHLMFAPVGNDSGAGYDSFSFSVNDGTADSVSTYTMTIDINDVNDAPTFDVGDGLVRTAISAGNEWVSQM